MKIFTSTNRSVWADVYDGDDDLYMIPIFFVFDDNYEHRGVGGSDDDASSLLRGHCGLQQILAVCLLLAPITNTAPAATPSQLCLFL